MCEGIWRVSSNRVLKLTCPRARQLLCIRERSSCEGREGQHMGMVNVPCQPASGVGTIEKMGLAQSPDPHNNLLSIINSGNCQDSNSCYIVTLM